MQELPQALPFVQVLQHAIVPAAGSCGSEATGSALPRLAVAVANSNPSTMPHSFQACFIVAPPSVAPFNNNGAPASSSTQRVPRRNGFAQLSHQKAARHGA